MGCWVDLDMHRRITILLLLLCCVSNAQFKSKYPKINCGVCGISMKETRSRLVCWDSHMSIEKSEFTKDENGNYYLRKTISGKYKKSKVEVTASKSLANAGSYLQDYVFYTIAGTAFSIFGVYLTYQSNEDGEPNVKGTIASVGGILISFGAILKVGEAGKELKKASKKLEKIEKKSG